MERFLRTVSLAGAALYIGYSAWVLFDKLVYGVDQHTLGLLSMLALFVCIMADSLIRFGPRTTLVLSVLVAVICYAAEYLGVHYGFPFGAQYYYTDQLGPKLGGVPVVIPSLWFVILYLSFGVADLIAGFSVNAQMAGRMGRTAVLLWCIWSALVGGMAATAWDLVIDPIMVENRVWVWDTTGPYYTVPIGNFAGWVVTAMAVAIPYRLWEASRPPVPAFFDLFGRLPVWMYAVTVGMAVLEATLHARAVPAMVGGFATAGFLLSAILRMVNNRVSVKTAGPRS